VTRLRIAGVLGLAALAALAALLAGGRAGLPGTAVGAPRCASAGDAVRTGLGRGERVRLAVGRGSRILLDGRPCGGARVDETGVIVLRGRGGKQAVVVDPAGGAFGATRIAARLGRGKDRLSLLGGPAQEHHRIARQRIELDPTVGSRISLSRVERLAILTGDGADRVDARSWRRPLSLQGRAGADRLLGGGARDVVGGGRGPDLMEGGDGEDRIDGGPAGDDCEGGAGRDALVSCMPSFDASAARLGNRLRRRIRGSSWHRGCPVGLGALRVLRMRHWTMANRDVHRGLLVVHRDAAADVLRAMRAVFEHRFPIRRMKLVDRYGASDLRSMNADNTSAFNCRFVAGTNQWSQHAFGRAIDINPIENPYVTGSGHVSPRAGRAYVDRSRRAPGMIHDGDAVVRAFARVGWGWGGHWSSVKDYQHFSANGR
jgi:D-alanyl-D-alanine carboxypeptidase/RTX calcium-binding nonapeptide repeat (4 copies)